MGYNLGPSLQLLTANRVDSRLVLAGIKVPGRIAVPVALLVRA